MMRGFGLIMVLSILASAAAAAEIPVSADAHVSSLTPQLNAGSLPTLNLNSGSRVYLRFPIGSMILPGTAPSQIASAWLHLWADRVDAAGQFDIFMTGNSWDESTVTWANVPPVVYDAGIGSADRTGSPVRADITLALQQAMAAHSTDLSLVLVARPGSMVSASFDSKENTATSHMPVIEVEVAGFMSTGPKGPAGLTGPQGPPGPAGASGFQTTPAVISVGCTVGSGCQGTAKCFNQELVSGSCGQAIMPLVFTGPTALSTSSPVWKCVWSGSWQLGLPSPSMDGQCAAR